MDETVDSAASAAEDALAAEDDWPTYKVGFTLTLTATTTVRAPSRHFAELYAHLGLGQGPHDGEWLLANFDDLRCEAISTNYDAAKKGPSPAETPHERAEAARKVVESSGAGGPRPSRRKRS